MESKAVQSCLALILAALASPASASDLRLRLTAGVVGPVEEAIVGDRYDIIRSFEFGRSPVIGVGVARRLHGLVSGSFQGAMGVDHPYIETSCSTRPGPCIFPLDPEVVSAQTYTYALSVEVGPTRWAVAPFAGVEAGGITYALGRGNTHTRGLWSVHGGVALHLGRAAVLVEGRRMTVSNPPFGLEAFHPFEVRAGVQLPLRRDD